MTRSLAGRRLAIVVIGAALTLPAPAAAQAPSDYQAGVEARLAGNADKAIELLGRVVAAEPRNADAQLQFGLALFARSRLDEAETALRTVLAIAPNYEDARIALARLQERRGDGAAALAELDRVSAANLEAADLRTRLRAGANGAAAFRRELDVDASYSSLSDAADWQDFAVRIADRVTPSTRIAAAVQQSHRFGANDTFAEVRVDHRAGNGGSLWLSGGATPNADFLPRWQLAAGGAFKLTNGPSATVATVEARHSRYVSGNVETLNPGVEQYLPGGHWLTARMINVVEHGEWRTGWLARGDFMATSRLRLFAGASDAPDVTEGIVVDTFALFGGLAFDANDRTTLRLSVNREDRDGTADRLEVSAGLGLRF